MKAAKAVTIDKPSEDSASPGVNKVASLFFAECFENAVASTSY